MLFILLYLMQRLQCSSCNNKLGFLSIGICMCACTHTHSTIPYVNYSNNNKWKGGSSIRRISSWIFHRNCGWWKPILKLMLIVSNNFSWNLELRHWDNCPFELSGTTQSRLPTPLIEGTLYFVWLSIPPPFYTSTPMKATGAPSFIASCNLLWQV